MEMAELTNQQHSVVHFPEDGIIYACPNSFVKDGKTCQLVRYHNKKYYRGNVIFKGDVEVATRMVNQLTSFPRIIFNRNKTSVENVFNSDSFTNGSEFPKNVDLSDDCLIQLAKDTEVALFANINGSNEEIFYDFIHHTSSEISMDSELTEPDPHNYTVAISQNDIGFTPDIIENNDNDSTITTQETTYQSISYASSEITFNNELIQPSPYKDQVKTPISNCNTNLRVSKREFCIFCKRLTTQIARHFTSTHKTEVQVQKFYYLPKGCTERKKQIETLRKEGQLQYNTQPERETDEQFITVRRPILGLNRRREDYYPCPKCHGYYSKFARRQHSKKCDVRMKGTRTTNYFGRMFIRKIHDSASKKMKETILPPLRDDIYTQVVCSDFLIIRCGNIWTEKYANEWDATLIRHKLRLMARLFTSVQSITNTVTDFSSILTPGNYKFVKEGLNKVASFEESKQIYKAPSTAAELGTLIKKVTKIYNTYLIENQEDSKKKLLKDFVDLLEQDLSDRINRTVVENQTYFKHQKKVNLPSNQDIKKLVIYVHKKRIKFLELFKSSVTLGNYVKLASYTLISLLIFNRRRAGEMERLLVENYKKYEEFKESTDPKILESLSPEGRAAVSNYVRVLLRGKLGRTVSVIIQKDIKVCMDHLIKNRVKVGISHTNPYVFGLPTLSDGRNRYIRACKLMREYSEKCGAENPVTLRGTTLRKHIATQAVTLQLNDAEIIDLATFMGHAEKIHREHYRLSIGVREVGIISKLLEKAQGMESDNPICQQENLPTTLKTNTTPMLGNILNSNTFEAFNSSPSECNPSSPTSSRYSNSDTETSSEDEELNPALNRSLNTHHQMRKSWSCEEREVLEATFSDFIKKGKVPGLHECQRVLKEHPELLAGRTPTTIKACINNLITSKQNSVCQVSVPSRRSWSSAEKKVLFTEFKNEIKAGKLPSKKQCDEIIQKYPEVFNSRHPSLIKTYISNEFRKRGEYEKFT